MVIRVIFTVIAALMLGANLFAQGEFLKSGQSGVGCALSLFQYKHEDTLFYRSTRVNVTGIAVDFLLIGRLNFSFFAGKGGSEPSSGAGINLFLLKHDERYNPVSVSIGCGYVEIDTMDAEYYAPGMIMVRIPLGKDVNLMPIAGINLNDFTSRGGPEIQNVMGISLFFDKSKSIVFISPKATLKKDGNTLGLSFGITFKQ